jgi:hypothetical protein
MRVTSLEVVIEISPPVERVPCRVAAVKQPKCQARQMLVCRPRSHGDWVGILWRRRRIVVLGRRCIRQNLQMERRILHGVTRTITIDGSTAGMGAPALRSEP